MAESRSVSHDPTLRDLGEFGLIARLTAGLETRPDVVLGTGDDAALLDLGAEDLLVATCDSLVEGRHFTRATMTPDEIGHRALAVNLSDVAAMGAVPLWALVSLLLPADLPVAMLDGVYAGMRALARRYAVTIVGGNVTGTSGPFALDITLLGRVARNRALTRSGARAGDVVLVTGRLGAAAAGVALLGAAAAERLDPAIVTGARRAMALPEPRIAAGQSLAETGVVTAMLDVSDSFAADLGHLCAASGVGAEIDAASLPVAPEALAIAPLVACDALDLALYGGEDYELVFTVTPDGIERAREAAQHAGVLAHVVGRVTTRTGEMVLRSVNEPARLLEPRGWDHLRTSGAV